MPNQASPSCSSTGCFLDSSGPRMDTKPIMAVRPLTRLGLGQGLGKAHRDGRDVLCHTATRALFQEAGTCRPWLNTGDLPCLLGSGAIPGDLHKSSCSAVPCCLQGHAGIRCVQLRNLTHLWRRASEGKHIASRLRVGGPLQRLLAGPHAQRAPPRAPEGYNRARGAQRGGLWKQGKAASQSIASIGKLWRCARRRAGVGHQ